MKAQNKQGTYIILIIVLLISSINICAQENARYITISGIVKDQRSKKKLEYVNVSVPGTGIGTISNEDGRFSIKISDSLKVNSIEFSRMGYYNTKIPVGNKDIADTTIFLNVNAKELSEVIIRSADPKLIVEESLNRISKNYSPNINMLTGFYRETVKKGRNYIDISEAVISMYKTPYSRGTYEDRVEILKGRKLLSQKASDTLAVKLVGGPALSINADLVKERDFLFDLNFLSINTFKHEDPVMIEQQQHYVISFNPNRQEIAPYPLFYGKLYINKNNLTIAKAEISLDMSDKNKVINSILRKKPPKLRFNPQEVSFVINYKEHNGLAYLNYIHNEIRFKCDWKRRLFSTNYSVVSEMIVTDIKEENISKISRKSAFKDSHVLSEKVSNFYDDDFWKDYNIIEPTESLESAISKLRKQYK